MAVRRRAINLKKSINLKPKSDHKSFGRGETGGAKRTKFRSFVLDSDPINDKNFRVDVIHGLLKLRSYLLPPMLREVKSHDEALYIVIG